MVCSVRLCQASQCSGPAHPPACRMPFRQCFILQTAHSTYHLTAGLKRTTKVSRSFSDIKPHWVTTNKQAGVAAVVGGTMRVDGEDGKEQPRQAEGAISFEGKQTPRCLCFFLGCLFMNTKSKDGISDVPLPAHPLCV